MMLRKTGIIVSILVSFFSSRSTPDQRRIYGTILSEEERAPLEGVTVFAKCSRHYSGSQADGAYYINVSTEDSILQFSLEEYETKEIKLTSTLQYDVTLKRK